MLTLLTQDQAEVIDELERDLHDKQQADAVASSNYDESVKEIKSQNKKLKELKKHMEDVSDIHHNLVAVILSYIYMMY